MKHEPRIIRHEIQVTASVAGYPPQVRPVSFIYNPRESFAVTLDCGTEDGPNLWRFDRETLVLGMDLATADPSGQVWARPTKVNGVPSAFITLSGADGRFTALAVQRQPLAVFLNEVYAAVPRGREFRHLDWQQALNQLIEVYK